MKGMSPRFEGLGGSSGDRSHEGGEDPWNMDDVSFTGEKPESKVVDERFESRIDRPENDGESIFAQSGPNGFREQDSDSVTDEESDAEMAEYEARLNRMIAEDDNK